MAVVDESMKTQIRIISSEVKGWDRNEVHSGKFDDREFNAWKGQPVQKFLQEAWNEGQWYRNLKDTWQAAFNEKGGLQNAVATLNQQVVAANTDLATAKSQVNELTQLNDQKQLAIEELTKENELLRKNGGQLDQSVRTQIEETHTIVQWIKDKLTSIFK